MVKLFHYHYVMLTSLEDIVQYFGKIFLSLTKYQVIKMAYVFYFRVCNRGSQGDVVYLG
jgi:hypothetical protein